MERVNVVVLASVAAALTMLGLRLWADSAASEFTVRPADASSFAFGADAARDRKLPPSRIAMYGGNQPRPGQRPTPGGTPAGEPGRRSRSGSRAGQSAELIAGLERRRDVLGSEMRRDGDVYETSTAELTDLLAGRTGSLPRAGNGPKPGEPPVAEPQPPELVEEPPRAGNPDVLLRIPFDGSVNPEVGGGDFMADGLVSGDGRVEFPDDAQLSFPAGENVNSEAGTIAFELRHNWDGADQTNNSLVQIRNEHVWENTLAIVKNYDALRYIIIDSAGVERNVNIPIGDWVAGETQIIAATWDTSRMRLYVNGELMGETPLPNPLSFGSTTPMHIGSDFIGTAYVGAGGSISDFTVYGRALGGEEIFRQ
jgi:hypothetical protein